MKQNKKYCRNGRPICLKYELKINKNLKIYLLTNLNAYIYIYI